MTRLQKFKASDLWNQCGIMSVPQLLLGDVMTRIPPDVLAEFISRSPDREVITPLRICDDCSEVRTHHIQYNLPPSACKRRPFLRLPPLDGAVRAGYSTDIS